MIDAHVERLDLDSYRAKDKEGIGHRGAWPVYSEKGSGATAVTYFEIAPNERIGSHTHDAEETIYVMQGRGTATVGEGTGEFEAGTILFVPAGTRHDLHNESDDVFRAVSFFPRATVVTIFDDVMEPDNTTRLGTPDAA